MASPFYHIGETDNLCIPRLLLVFANRFLDSTDASDAAGTREERGPIGRGQRKKKERSAHIAPMETVNETGKTV